MNWRILTKSFSKYISDDMLTQSAALSYYTIFSLPPMLLVILKTAASFYDEKQVKTAIFKEFGHLVGNNGALQIMHTIDKLNIFEPNVWSTLLSTGLLLFTSTTVFITMQNALNIIFNVKAAETTNSGIIKMLRDRVVSFTLVLSMAFILLVSLIVDALLAAFAQYLQSSIGDITEIIVFLTSILFPTLVITLLFAMLFKFLPDARLEWSDTWFGAFVTAVLFTFGKYIIGFYIGKSNIANLYEAAGSVLVIMLWVYYASAIFLFGATFTYVRASYLKGRIKPADYAVRVKQKEITVEKGEDAIAENNS